MFQFLTFCSHNVNQADILTAQLQEYSIRPPAQAPYSSWIGKWLLSSSSVLNHRYVVDIQTFSALWYFSLEVILLSPLYILFRY